MNIKANIQNKKGITLLEILLYLSLASVVLLSVSVFITSIIRSRVKNQSISLVNEEAQQIISQLEIELLEADSITAPAEGSSASSISFQVVGDPVETIDLQSGVVTYTLTGDPAIDLHSSNTNVTNLNFTRMNTVNDNENIKLEFTIGRNSNNSLNEYQFSKTFYTTINLPRETGEPETYI